MRFKLFKNKDKTQEKAVLKSQKSHKKSREKSRGRSMVEMLGVLAIIGVLSIGGIQGYTLAMRKYRANEIVSFMTKYTGVVYTGFYNYMINNGDNVILNDNHERGTVYACSEDGNYYSNSNCPYYHSDVNDFKNLGLGAIPSGIQYIRTFVVFPASDEFPQERVQVNISFTDTELCKAVGNILAGFYSSSDGGDQGVDCDKSRIIDKDIPVD